MNKRSLPITLMGLIGTIVVILIGAYCYYASYFVTTDNAYLHMDKILISPKVTGIIENIYFEDNAYVEKGVPLFKIEDTTYQAKVDQAKAEVEAAAARRLSLEQQENLQKTIIQEAEAGVSATKATLKEADNNLRRTKKLNAKGAESDRLLDIATSKQLNALSASMQAIAKLQGATESLEVIRSKKLAAAAELKKAKASLRLSEIALDDTIVKAPFSGAVTHRGIYLGQLVSPGMNLAYLVQNRLPWIEANFKESQIEHLRKGQNVTIRIDAYPSIKFQGHITSFTPAAGAEFSILPPENASGNFTKVIRRIPVRISVDNPSDKLALLKSGLSAEITVRL